MTLCHNRSNDPELKNTVKIYRCPRDCIDITAWEILNLQLKISTFESRGVNMADTDEP